MKIIREITIDELKKNLYNLDLSDKNIYVEANNPNTVGIFQLDSGTSSRVLEKVVPKNFEEIVAISSLARPGTIDFTDEYVDNKNTGSRKYPEKVNEILADSHGVMLFQEHTLKIFNQIGGFTLPEADGVRGLMKKLGKADKKKEDVEKWDKTVERFKQGAEKNGISKEDAVLVANDLLKMSGYSFNKSHAVAYTYISAMTLYLSFYFRKFFYSAVMSYEVDRKKYLINKMMSVKKQGFKILKPDINKSKLKIAPISDFEIVYGLLDIKNLGKSVDQIVANRPYSSFRDFVITSLTTEGNKVNSRAIESLLKAGAFECFNENTVLLLSIFKAFWEKKKSIKLREKLETIYDEIEKSISSFTVETTLQDKINMEKEIYGHNFFTSYFMEERLASILAEGLAKRKIVISFDDIEEECSERVPVFVSNMRFHTDKKGGKMAFIEIEDPTGDSIELPLFASVWKHIEDKIEVGTICMMVLNRNAENKIMFGRGGWENKADVLRSWIKKYTG